MSVHLLKPWTKLVKLHPDVESGSLTEPVFAIDLGAIAVGDPATPLVYRDPDAIFAATYVTTGLHRLLEEVLDDGFLFVPVALPAPAEPPTAVGIGAVGGTAVA